MGSTQHAGIKIPRRDRRAEHAVAPLVALLACSCDANAPTAPSVHRTEQAVTGVPAADGGTSTPSPAPIVTPEKPEPVKVTPHETKFAPDPSATDSLTERRSIADSAPEFVAVDGDWLLTVTRRTTPSIRFFRVESGQLRPAASFESRDVELRSTEAVALALDGGAAAIGVWPHQSAAKFQATGSAEVPGHVITYRLVGDAWTADSTLRHPDGEAETRFGFSVALTGNTLVVGDPGKSERGAAFVYEHDGSGWALSESLAGVDVSPGEEFGSSVAVSGDTVVVGAPGDVTIVPGDPKAANSWGAGAVHVFERSAESKAFAQVAFLRTDAPPRGEPFCRGMSCRWIAPGVERFGADVAVAGDWIVVGAPGQDDHGAAHVFFRDRALGMSDPWGLYDMLLPQEGQRGFGSRVRADAERIAVGCAEDDYAPGVVRGKSTMASLSLFALQGDRWAPQGSIQTPVSTGASRAEFDLGTDEIAVAGYRPLGTGFADVYRIGEAR